MLFVYSLLLSRTVDVVRDDMDEPVALTAEFGHCTQVRESLIFIRVKCAELCCWSGHARMDSNNVRLHGCRN